MGREGPEEAGSSEGMLGLPQWDSKLSVCTGPPPLTPHLHLSLFLISHQAPKIYPENSLLVLKAPCGHCAIRGTPPLLSPQHPRPGPWGPQHPTAHRWVPSCPALPHSCSRVPAPLRCGGISSGEGRGLALEQRMPDPELWSTAPGGLQAVRTSCCCSPARVPRAHSKPLTLPRHCSAPPRESRSQPRSCPHSHASSPALPLPSRLTLMRWTGQG